ncbi:MAG: ABC transporter permease [Spirochaetota bacterium]
MKLCRAGAPTGRPPLGANAPVVERSLMRRVVVVGIVVLVALPLVPLVLHSLAGRWLYPDLVPESWGLRAWEYVVRPRSRVLEATATSLGVAVAVTALSLLVGVPAGRGLAAVRPRARAALEYLFFAPVIVPALSVALGLHVVFVRWGLADSVAGVVVAHLLPTVPYMVLVMASTFSRSQLELEHQARTLGAGPVRAFLTVGLPSAVPGMLTGALFVFLISWSQYALTVLIGGGRVLTLPLLLFSFASAGDLGLTAALSIVFLAPAVVILAFTARYLSGRSLALAGVAG